MKVVEQAILSTDLALYFRKKDRFLETANCGEIDWQEQEKKERKSQFLLCIALTRCTNARAIHFSNSPFSIPIWLNCNLMHRPLIGDDAKKSNEAIRKVAFLMECSLLCNDRLAISALALGHHFRVGVMTSQLFWQPQFTW